MPPPTAWAQTDAFPATLDHRRGCLALDPAYAVETNTAAFAYTPDAALDAPTPFVYGFVLPAAWYPHRLHHAAAAAVQTFRCGLVCDTDVPDCVYRCGLYAKTRAGGGLDAWEVVHADEAAEWTPGQPLVLDVPTAALAGVYAAHRNRALDPAAKAEAVEPALVVGFARVDFGQPPAAHTMRLEALTVEAAAASAHGATGTTSAANAAACATPVLTTLRTPDQLAQPVAVLTETALAPYVGLGHDRPLTVQFLLQGTYAGVDRLAVVFQPANHPPTVLPALVRPEGTFAVAGHPVFPSTVTAIEIRLDVGLAPASSTAFVIDITDLQATPHAAFGGAGAGGGLVTATGGGLDGSDGAPALHDALDFGTITQLKQRVEQLMDTTQTLQKAAGPQGAQGKRGPKGERGEALRFDDLTSAQQDALRGKRGPAGPRGKQMVFEDLTPEQRGLLRGEKGSTGETGKQGDRGPRGVAGTCFTFDDLTDVQRALLKGERGDKGDRGDALAFEDLTEVQKQALKGKRGDPGHTGDPGKQGERGRVGPMGPVGPEGKQGPRGLPGIPGAKGDKGGTGRSGRDGAHGRPAVVKSSFASVELLRDFVHKSLHLAPNTYYLIDHPDQVGGGGDQAQGAANTVDGGAAATVTKTPTDDHGALFAYTGALDLELVVGCTYVENVAALLDEYKALLRAQVQTDTDEWRVSLTLRSDDVGVYHLRRGLETALVQSGYAVKESTVTDDALQRVGRLAGVRGHRGETGAQGAPGQSMLGMRLDHVGTEATRLKLGACENHTVFLQVKPTQNSVAGFYLYDGPGGQWRLLHGVDVADSFLQWMAAFVDNPNQESIPLVLSMFATTKKQMDGSVQGVRQELSEYRTSNEKWKKYQFEHWKSMGSSQYQQFNTQLTEQTQLTESMMQQLQGVTEKAVGRDELGQLRKLVEKQVDTVHRQCQALKSSMGDLTEHQTVDKHVFEREQEAVQAKLRDVDASLLRMLKIIQFLKTAPWTAPTKRVQQDVTQLALAHEALKTAHAKRHTEVQAYLDKEFPEALKAVQDEVGAVLEKFAASEVALDRKFVDWGDTYDKRLLAASSDATEATLRVQKELLAHTDRTRAEVVAQLSTKLFGLKQELLEATNELREGANQHEHETKRSVKAVEKKVEEVETALEAAVKKQGAQHDAQWREATEAYRAKLDQAVDKTTKDTDRKLLQTVDALQQERREAATRQADQLKDVAAALTETKTDLLSADERWTERFDEQRQKHATLVDHQVERARLELQKLVQEAAATAAERLAEAQTETKQRQAQLAYDLQAAGKRTTDVDAKLQEAIDRVASQARTSTDERLRELDQKYSNAFQGLTTEVQGVDAKCGNVDYMLKARLESVEEHIQQLYSEGQQQSEALVAKHAKETRAALEGLRDDVVGQQRQGHKTLSEQLQRHEAATTAARKDHADRLDALDAAVAGLRKADEAAAARAAQQAEAQTAAVQQLRADLQDSLREVVKRLDRDQEAAGRALDEATRDVRAQLHAKHDDVATAGATARQALEERVQQQYEARSRETQAQLKQLKGVLEGMCAHVDNFTQKEAAQRAAHETRLQQVVGLLERTFAEVSEGG